MDYTRTIALPLVSAAAQVFKLRTGAGAGVFSESVVIALKPQTVQLQEGLAEGFF